MQITPQEGFLCAGVSPLTLKILATERWKPSVKLQRRWVEILKTENLERTTDLPIVVVLGGPPGFKNSIHKRGYTVHIHPTSTSAKMHIHPPKKCMIWQLKLGVIFQDYSA